MIDMAGSSKGFITEFQRLHQEHRTGMLFVLGSSRAVVQMNMEAGEIVYAACQGKRGRDVIPFLQGMSSGKLRFVEGAIPALRTPLPSTSEILNQLGRQSVSTPTPTTPMADQQLSASVRTVLQQELTKFIGPFAQMIVQEQLVGVHDVDTALITLSKMLPNPVQVDLFKSNVRKGLGKQNYGAMN